MKDEAPVPEPGAKPSPGNRLADFYQTLTPASLAT